MAVQRPGRMVRWSGYPIYRASWKWRDGPHSRRSTPLALLVSACLTGQQCGVEGSSYGAPYSHTSRMLQLPNVHVVAFCPEDFAFGTPRATPDIHGGTGFDVLDGTARVLSDTGEDWTAQMLAAADAMLRVAQENDVRLALMDISAACVSQVITTVHGRHAVTRRGKGSALRS